MRLIGSFPLFFFFSLPVAVVSLSISCFINKSSEKLTSFFVRRDLVCPVCEMGVKMSDKTPFILYRGGQRVYLCCHACMETFEATNRYVANSVSASSAHSPSWYRDFIEKHDVSCHG